ncbi:MAG TPA: DUF5522 domain-containing protein [Chitinophagaceae bacterium]|nr:hypothetical protein [Chitinophagaceae bacterium]HQU57289.1 DUF5522 domain-containing protein [Chitinophagaceae bacterium]
MDDLEEEKDFYFSNHGYVVLTEEYLLNRGYCCGNGCLHCPYDYKNVPEPRRTHLLTERKKRINSTTCQPPKDPQAD